MKKILVVSMVLGIAAMVANAGITTTLVKTGTYTCVTTGGGTFTVKQYTLGADAGPGNKIAGFAVYLRAPVVQAWGWTFGEDETYGTADDVITATPTMTGVPASGIAKDADTHLLFSDEQLLNAVAPAETNDETLGYTSGRRKWGLGQNTLDDTKSSPNVLDVSFMAVCGLAPNVQAQSVNFLQIGLRADWEPTWGWGFGTVTDGFIEQDFFFIPEPTTSTLLGLGALALIRRRRWRCA